MGEGCYNDSGGPGYGFSPYPNPPVLSYPGLPSSPGSPTSGGVSNLSAGFADALQDLRNKPDCANLIAGNSGGTPYSGAGLADILAATPVRTATDNGNSPVTITPTGPPAGNYSYSYQFAYTTGSAIYLNGNYFPDPTLENIDLPDGSTTSLIQLVNNTLSTNMSAEQFAAFVLLHELSHIVDSGSKNNGTIDTNAYNQSIVATCLH
jgi:hypothetical protein